MSLKDLRAKTDRQLALLIRNRLRRGLALAHEEEGEARVAAEQAQREACAWLPLLAPKDRGAMAEMLAELSQRLEVSEVRVQAACF
jgi:hypothetical protein